MFIRFFSPRTLRPFYEGDDGGGNQGGNQGDQQQQGDPAAAFQRLLERNNSDALRLAEQLYRENHDYRTRNRDLTAQLPAQGTVVLSAEQAQAWTAYQQLGQASDIQTAIAERQTLATRVAELEQDGVLRDVASVAGYKHAVLKTVGAGLTYAIKDETVNGKAAKVVYVQHKDAAGADVETPLTKYAETNWSDFLPALKAQTEQARPAIGNATRPLTQPPAQGAQLQQRKPTLKF